MQPSGPSISGILIFRIEDKMDVRFEFDFTDQRYFGGLQVQGRFLTADPYEASGGATNPWSWNRYGYVGSDPINWKDPKGLQRVCENGVPEHPEYGCSFYPGRDSDGGGGQGQDDGGYRGTDGGGGTSLQQLCKALPTQGSKSIQVTIGTGVQVTSSLNFNVDYISGNVTVTTSVSASVGVGSGFGVSAQQSATWNNPQNGSLYDLASLSGSYGDFAGGAGLSSVVLPSSASADQALQAAAMALTLSFGPQVSVFPIPSLGFNIPGGTYSGSSVTVGNLSNSAWLPFLPLDSALYAAQQKCKKY